MIPQPNGQAPKKDLVGAHAVMKHGPGVVPEEWKDRMARASNPHRNADAWKMLGAQQTTTVQKWAKDDEAREAEAGQQLAAKYARMAELAKEKKANYGVLEDDQEVCMTQLFDKGVLHIQD
jgi:hypothetical protein